MHLRDSLMSTDFNDVVSGSRFGPQPVQSLASGRGYRRGVCDWRTDEHVRRSSRSLHNAGFVVQGQPQLRRLIDFLRRLNVCDAPTTPTELTPVEQTIAAYAGRLQKDQGLSDRALLQYCPFAEAFLSQRFGAGSVDLSSAFRILGGET
jgi:hypothetical protein